MRQIGHIETEAAAKLFGDYLYAQGIKNDVEHEQADGWAVWIHDEEELSRANGLLAEFRANPADAKFSAKARDAEKLRSAEQKAQADYEKKMLGRRHLFRPLRDYNFGPLTFVLIAASVVVFFKMKFGDDIEAIKNLFIKDFVLMVDFKSKDLPEVAHGEVWRLLTPIFIHFSVMHIVFNMLWLRDLGSMIEARQNSLVLGMLVVVIGVCSNLGQFYAVHPLFGGMSGVVYGLMGYIWIRGKCDPGSGLFLHPTTVWMMLIWYFLCWSGFVCNVANIAHTVGLVMGIAWGWVSSWRYNGRLW